MESESRTAALGIPLVCCGQPIDNALRVGGAVVQFGGHRPNRSACGTTGLTAPNPHYSEIGIPQLK